MYHFISQLFRHLQFQFAFIENFKQNCNYSCVWVCEKQNPGKLLSAYKHIECDRKASKALMMVIMMMMMMMIAVNKNGITQAEPTFSVGGVFWWVGTG